MRWSPLLHIYQPPRQDPAIIRAVSRESYERILGLLERNSRAKLTLNINAVLSEQLIAVRKATVLKRIRRLAERGQLELTGSAKHHAILPLLPPSEIERQVWENERANRRIFGPVFKPAGFFLPELCYSERVARQLARLGYRWIILDEVAFSGQFGDRRLNFNRPYRLSRSPLAIFFRHRLASDLFFSATLKTKGQFIERVRSDRRIRGHVITACDGENFGHHHPSLIRVLAALLADRRVETSTLSERVGEDGPIIIPLASSWSSRPGELAAGVPYVLWHNPRNSIHRLQWRLTRLVLAVFHRSRHPSTSGRLTLDEALHSDQYWWASATPWFGVERVTAGVNLFIESLRRLPAPPRSVEQANRLGRRIIATTKEWLAGGYAASLQRAYLAGETLPRMFGGRVIRNN